MNLILVIVHITLIFALSVKLIGTESRNQYQSQEFLKGSHRQTYDTQEGISGDISYDAEMSPIENGHVPNTKDSRDMSVDYENTLMLFPVESQVLKNDLSPAIDRQVLANAEENRLIDGTGLISMEKNLSYGKPVFGSLTFHRLPLIDDATSSHKNSKLLSLVLEVLERELLDCDLLVAYDEHFNISSLLQTLSMLPNKKQMLLIENPETLSSILWTSTHCRGYLFLLSGAQPIFTFVNENLSSWDYEGRYVFAGFSLADLDVVVSSEKGRKTEKIVGIVQSRSNGEWTVFINQLFSNKKLKRINSWKRGKSSSVTTFFPDKTDLMGAPLKISTFPWASDVYYYKKPNSSRVLRTGIDVEVIKIFAKLLNFTTVYERPPNGVLWGGIQKDGNWTGMVGVLQRNDAHIGCPITMSIAFLGVADFTDAFKFRKICFVVRAEPPLPQWLAITYPFHKWTWLAVFAGFFISGSILYVLSLLGRKLNNEREAFSSFLESIQYAFGMHLNEPPFYLPTRPNTKIYIAFLWLYCLIISISYSANLKAFLMTKKLPKQIETIQDLKESGNILIGLDPFYKVIFQSSPNEHLQELAKHFKIITDQKEILSAIDKGGYVYPGDNRYQESYIAIRRALQRGNSKLIQIKECYGSVTLTFALQKYFPLRRRFNTIIQNILSGGLIASVYANTLRLRIADQREEKKNELANKKVEIPVTANPNVPLSMDHMQAVFYITFALWVISLNIFAIEIFSVLMSPHQLLQE